METTGRIRAEIYEADNHKELERLIDIKLEHDWNGMSGQTDYHRNFIDIKYNVVIDSEGKKIYSAMVITMD